MLQFRCQPNMTNIIPNAYVWKRDMSNLQSTEDKTRWGYWTFYTFCNMVNFGVSIKTLCAWIRLQTVWSSFLLWHLYFMTNTRHQEWISESLQNFSTIKSCSWQSISHCKCIIVSSCLSPDLSANITHNASLFWNWKGAYSCIKVPCDTLHI